MKIANVKNFEKGWFVGNFTPSVFHTNDFELALHQLSAGHISDNHYHLEAVEINLIVTGIMMVNGEELSDGDIFRYDPRERTKVECITDVQLVVCKSPSSPGDKYY